ncbi:MAG: PEP-utilizing enzyme [Candidatus Buchananbacteria bacterium]
MKIDQITKIKWVARWAGSYTFISCAYWGKQYKYSLEKKLGIGFNNVLFFHQKGTVSFLIKKGEFENFGRYLANKTIRNKKMAIRLLADLKINSDKILKLMKKMAGKIPTAKEYKNFLAVFEKHLAYHNFMKKTVDFLPEKNLHELMKYFKEARIYSEPVYSETESFFRKLAKAIAKKEKYNPDLLTCLLPEELENYLAKGNLPASQVLKKRYLSSALYFKNGNLNLITGDKVKKIENLISQNNKQKNRLVKGTSVYPGKVGGVARIILNPKNGKNFKPGNILITGMTRPEFLPIIRKASAIVTDVGGALCHAAITSRELKIPCIVGTGNATKVYKNGDLVEVDASQGIVKLIKK